MIVNVGSIGGKMTLPWLTLYSASKYAVGSLTEGLRMELLRDNVHAMLVCPGYVRHGFQQNALGGEPPSDVQRSRRYGDHAGAMRRRPSAEESSGARGRCMAPSVGLVPGRALPAVPRRDAAAHGRPIE